VAGENDNRLESITFHFAAELLDPRAKQVGKDAVLRLHYKGVRLAEASYAAEQGRRYESTPSLCRPDAKCVRLDGVEADDVVHPVPFDCPERLKDCRTVGLGLVDFFGPQELKPYLTLSRRVRAV